MTPLKTTCGCCTLRTGTIIIAVISTIFNLFAMVAHGTVPFEYGDIYENIVILVLRVLDIIFGAILLFGAIKRKCALLLPWLVLALIIMILMTGVLFFEAVTHFQPDDDKGIWTHVGIILVYECVSIYSWLLVFSYFKELRASTNVAVGSPTSENKA